MSRPEDPRDAELESLLAAARSDDAPSAEDRRRVRASLMAAVAAGTPPTVGFGEGVSAPTNTAGAGSAGGAGAMFGAKGWLAVALLAAGGGALAGLLAGGGDPSHPSHPSHPSLAEAPSAAGTSHATAGDGVRRGADRTARSDSPLGPDSPLRPGGPGSPNRLDGPAPSAAATASPASSEAGTGAAPQRAMPSFARPTGPKHAPAVPATPAMPSPPTGDAPAVTRAADASPRAAMRRPRVGPPTTAHRSARLAGPPAPTGRAGDSSDELALIRRAHTALTRGDGDAAMRLLERYRQHHPAGVFAQEAAGLRVLALCSQGRTDAARRAGAQFLRAHPNAPLRARVAQACQPAEGSQR